MLKAVPVDFKTASAFVNKYHRHHISPPRDKYRVGCERDGELVGVAMVGRPVSAVLAKDMILEVTRLCVLDNETNVCSFLYSRCARIAKEMGYTKIITYILSTENGTSLKASGWYCEDADCGGATWECSKRSRERHMNEQLELFPQREKYPVGVKKQRWVKLL